MVEKSNKKGAYGLSKKKISTLNFKFSKIEAASLRSRPSFLEKRITSKEKHMDKEVFAKLLEVLTEDDGEKAKLIPFETEEDAIKHAEWAAKLKPGDKVNILGHGVAVVSPESMRGNRIILFCPRKKDDGTYNIGCSLCPISAIVPVD